MNIKKIVAPALAALLSLSLAACGTGDSAAVRGECPALPTDAPTVERTGEGVFPEVKGGFGETPEITPAQGDPSPTLQAKTLVKGDGALVCADDHVRVNYAGVLWDGTSFDSSFERGEPIDFSLNAVIKGWKYGLAGQRVGDRVLLTIPSDLGYGSAGAGNIPPNAPLVFVVDILDARDTMDLSALKNAKETGNSLPEGFSITGKLGEEPTLTYGPGTAPTEESRIVIAQGQGEPLAAEDQAIVRSVAVFQESAEQPPSTWDQPQIIPVGPVNLVDVTVGTRLAISRPAVEGQFPASVIVVDIAGIIKGEKKK